MQDWQTMPTPQDQYDDAMFDFSRAEFDPAIAKLRALLASHPDHFDAQLALGMAFYRKGDFAAAIAEGHKAEQLRPKEQLVHTNLSLFYMKAGDKVKAEHHGLQARIAGWRENMTDPAAGAPADPELQFAAPKPASTVVSAQKLPDMPWKKKPAPAPAPTPQASPAPSPQPSPPTQAAPEASPRRVGERESAPNQVDNTPTDPPPSDR